MNQNLRLIIIVGIGAVIGSVINSLLGGGHAPNWLTQTTLIGLERPLELNLSVLRFTFGLSLELSFASVLGMLIALFAFNKLK